MSFAKDHVEGEGGFAGAGDTGNHRHFVARDFHFQILEVVLAGFVNDDVVDGALAEDRVALLVGFGAALAASAAIGVAAGGLGAVVGQVGAGG